MAWRCGRTGGCDAGGFSFSSPQTRLKWVSEFVFCQSIVGGRHGAAIDLDEIPVRGSESGGKLRRGCDGTGDGLLTRWRVEAVQGVNDFARLLCALQFLKERPGGGRRLESCQHARSA